MKLGPTVMNTSSGKLRQFGALLLIPVETNLVGGLDALIAQGFLHCSGVSIAHLRWKTL